MCRTANALTELGVRNGNRVAIYMPMIPETVVAMLACARLGAPHMVVFGGFSADALSSRILDCDAHTVITSDGGYRRGNAIALKPAVDEALKDCPDVQSVLVVRRTGQEIDWTEGRDVWWHDLAHDQPAAGCDVRQAGRRDAGPPGDHRGRRGRHRAKRAGWRGRVLVIKEPWPSMLRTIWGDDERYIKTYWSRFDGMYFAGDGAKKDADGDLWLLGRVDDVMLVSGHNISTTEVESALVSHPRVAEAAVVGASDPVTGQGIVAFTILRGEGGQDGDDLAAELRNHVAQVLGPVARPRQILVVAELPKTRSGKIMRRLLRDVAEHRSLGDVTTLTDSAVMDLIKEQLPTAKSDD